MVSLPWASESPFLISSHVMLMLLVQEPHLDSKAFIARLCITHAWALPPPKSGPCGVGLIFPAPPLAPMIGFKHTFFFLSNHFLFTGNYHLNLQSFGQGFEHWGKGFTLFILFIGIDGPHIYPTHCGAADLQLKRKTSQRDCLKFCLLDRCLWGALVGPRRDQQGSREHPFSFWEQVKHWEIMKRELGWKSLPYSHWATFDEHSRFQHLQL